MSSKYEFIDGEKANYRISNMCLWLEVSRSGFYEWRDRPASATAERRAEITVLVVELHAEFEQRYGYRKLQAELGRRCTGLGVAGPLDHDRERPGLLPSETVAAHNRQRRQHRPSGPPGRRVHRSQARCPFRW